MPAIALIRMARIPIGNPPSTWWAYRSGTSPSSTGLAPGHYRHLSIPAPPRRHRPRPPMHCFSRLLSTAIGMAVHRMPQALRLREPTVPSALKQQLRQSLCAGDPHGYDSPAIRIRTCGFIWAWVEWCNSSGTPINPGGWWQNLSAGGIYRATAFSDGNTKQSKLLINYPGKGVDGCVRD